MQRTRPVHSTTRILQPESETRMTHTSQGIFYRQYDGEPDLKYIMKLVQNELSEPYVMYTYRYFLQGWPNLSFLAFAQEDLDTPIGVIVCKQSIHKQQARRGYIAMLSVNSSWRKRGIASTLVKLSVEMMIRTGADEVVLETEVDNSAALALYSSLGFMREKRLYRFYMNGKDAFRLVLPILPSEQIAKTSGLFPTQPTPPKAARNKSALTLSLNLNLPPPPSSNPSDYGAGYFDDHVGVVPDINGYNIPSSISPPIPPRPIHHRVKPVYDSDEDHSQR